MAQRILIIEDDNGSSLVLKSRLEAQGYEVVTSDSGTKAVASLREHAFSAVLISDELTRGIDALEVLRRTRAMPELAALPIFFYHQRAGLPAQPAKAYELGASGYLAGDELPTLEHELRYQLRVRSRLQELIDGLRTAHEQLRKQSEGRSSEGGPGRDSSEHQAALRELAHARPDGALIVDAEGLVVFADRGACDLLGARLEGRHLASLVPGSGLEAFVRDAHIEAREGCRFELPARKGRAMRSLTATVVPLLALPGSQGQVRKVVLLGDLQRRRLAAEALRVDEPSLVRAQMGALVEAARRIYHPGAWVGDGKRVTELRAWLSAALRNDEPVLIQGSGGTGKRTAARTLHYHAARTGPFLELQAKGIAEETLEAELFGVGRPTSNGASANHGNGNHADRPGCLHLAQDGTLYISEIDALPLALQQRLLSYLQSGSFTRRGATRPERSEVRIIASTSADLSALCHSGAFLPELAERLASHMILMPTLAQRPEDIGPIAQQLLCMHGADRGVRSIQEDALALLRAHAWPGNLRELDDCIRHAVCHAHDGAIVAESLPRGLRESAEKLAQRDLVPMRRPEGPRIEGTHTSQTGLVPTGAGSPAKPRELRPWDITDEDPLSLDLYEKKALLRALSVADNDKLAAAKLLKLGKSTMYRKLKRYGIP